MAKMYFKYGTMKSGKSLELIRTLDAYEIHGKKALVVKPSVDTRSGEGKIKSRMGFERTALEVSPGAVQEVSKTIIKNEKPDVILVDEAQFFTEEDIKAFKMLVLKYDVPVVAFGLKNDYRNGLFEGSRALLVYSDKIEEIKSICTYCNSKATMNLRLREGKPVKSGSQIAVGDEEYVPVCHYHWEMGGAE